MGPSSARNAEPPSPPQLPPPAPQPVPEQPVYEEPAYEAPVVEEPAYKAPVYEEPAYEEPVYEEPVYEAPAPQPEAEAPAYEQPSYEQPVYEAPAYEQPVYDPVPAAPAPNASGYFTPTPRAGANPPKTPNAPAAQHVPAAQKKRNTLILAIAAGVVLVAIIAIVLLLSFSGKSKGGNTPEAPKSSLAGSKADSSDTSKGGGKASGKGDSGETGKGSGKAAGKDAALAGDETLESAEVRPEETDEDETEPTDEDDIFLQEQGMLLTVYQAMLEACAEETTDDFAAANNNGYVWEYDDDSYPEMVFLCSFDNVSLSALIVRRTDDTMNPMMIEEKLWDVMPDNAINAIFSGVLDGEPVLYLEATSMEDGFEVGRSYVYSLANTTIEKLYALEWTCYEDGTLNTCCVMDGNGKVSSTDDEDHFLSIYNSAEYYEASYPYKDGCGRLFEDMLTTEALELIYG